MHVNVQKRDDGKISRERGSAPHWSSNQLFAFAALILATSLVRFDERLADAQWGRERERARQLLGARDLDWRFIQLRHLPLVHWRLKVSAR
jgi:hypothetical protein